VKSYHFNLLSLLVLAAGCGLVDDKPGVPHMIVVQSFNLSTTLDEGTDSHDIDEVWVYTETDVLGVFPLPAEIPVVYENEQESIGITLLAGIRANGIAATRKPYTFYETMVLDQQYDPGTTDTVVFNSTYIENANIILAEDFESANRFQTEIGSLAEIVRTTNEDWVFEGGASGLILLTDSLAYVNSTTQEQLFDLPDSGPIWLEFNYRCDNSFAVGLEVIGGGSSQRTPIIVLHPTDEEWKKMYLDLGPLVWSTPDAYGYEITLDAIIDTQADGTLRESGYVVVDNFKIVHY
jgi:hypothetical protein